MLVHTIVLPISLIVYFVIAVNHIWFAITTRLKDSLLSIGVVGDRYSEFMATHLAIVLLLLQSD